MTQFNPHHKNAPSPSNQLVVPSSVSLLSIPFFSRSSSSSNSSSTLTSTDLDTSFSELSSPGFTPTTSSGGNYSYGIGISQSLALRKSTSSSSSGLRPGLKKMPNWSSSSININLDNINDKNTKNNNHNSNYSMNEGHNMNKTWSPRTSEDSMRRQSSESEFSNYPPGNDEDDSNGRRKSLIKIDFGTWSKKPRIIFSSRSTTTLKRKSLSSITKLKIKTASVSTTKLQSAFPSSRGYKEDINIEEEEKNDQGIPLKRVWARTEEQNERERRGSDWPPTQSREMILNLSCIPTFTGENLGSMEVQSEFANLQLDDENTAKNEGEEVEQGEGQSQRVDTPLELPFLPKLNLRKSHSSILSPVLDDEEEEEEEEEGQKEQRGERVFEKGQGGRDEEEKEEFFTPCFNPSSSFTKSSYPSKFQSESASSPSPNPGRTPFSSKILMAGDKPEEESPQFDLSIFSPRPNQPRTPVIRGIIDFIPISPLELPSTLSILEGLQKTFPTPVLSKDSPNSPVMVMPIPRKGLPNQSIESVLNPSSLTTNSNSNLISTSDSPSRTIFSNSYTLGRKYSLNERRPSSKPSYSSAFITSDSTPVLPRRRMSLIVRPSVLPCPTPPSLLTSPKTLGSEYIPAPLFSPSSISPTNTNFNVNAGSGATFVSGLPIRRGRGSLKLKLPPSHFANSSGSGLGIGPTKNDDEENEKEEHVPTPGTFGLEGEKEKVVQAEINPYFA